MFKYTRMAMAAAVLSLAATTSQAQSWQLLGSTTSEPRLEQSIINMTRSDGKYQAIMLEVAKNDAQIIELRIVYGNGQPEVIPVKDVFRAGAKSRRIALSGGDRFLKQVIVTYRALGPVQINVYGDRAETAKWVELGCRSVGFGVDRDAIRLSQQDGVFKSIRLRVIGNKIEVFDARVIYGNGAADNLPVRYVIPDRGQTGPIDLRGDKRALDRVEMIYRSQPSFKGQAVVCVDGLRVSN